MHVESHLLRRAWMGGGSGVVLAAALAWALAAPSAASTGKSRTTKTAPRSTSPALPLAEALATEGEAAKKASKAFGMSVIDLSDGSSIYAVAPDDLRILASNTKLLTTAAALGTLGPAHEFETKFSLRGSVVDGTLTGDLAVFAGGDPNLSGRFHNGDSLAVFRSWADVLKERGVTRVTGDLYLVDGIFELPRIHPDWPQDQLGYWYEAPVDALSFDDNCVLIRVTAGDKPGAAAHVSTIPPMGYFRILSTASTIEGKSGGSLLVRRADDTDTIFVTGAIPQKPGAVDVEVAVQNPAEYLGAALRAAFAQRGIRIDGATKLVDASPEGVWQQVAIWKSDLLRTLEVTNKHSQNLYAETLTKFLGWKKAGKGSWENGVSAILDFLGTLGISRDAVKLSDGSGLSRRNEATPRAMTLLLEKMFAQPYGRDFMRTLPSSGERGLTWRFRLSEQPYRGNVLAKTGTINGVSTLSGYARAVSGKLYAFSILCNEVRNNYLAHAAQDRILRALIDRG